MLKEVNKKYANVTRDVLNLFKEMCKECQLKKRKIASKGLVVKPLLSKDFNSRGQVDLVDMQSMHDGDILHYQDHLTKFAVLRPLTSKLAAEVGFQLLDIFLLFGHSQTLLCMVIYLFQSDGYCSFQTTNFRPILHFLLLFSHI
jgi:hypothetical protein